MKDKMFREKNCGGGGGGGWGGGGGVIQMKTGFRPVEIFFISTYKIDLI